MGTARRPPFGQSYAFVVVAVVFVSLLAAAGLRSAPGVLLTPWHEAFGWDRGVISFAAALGIFLYGLVGPFSAALMQSVGVRRTLAGALVLMSVSTGLSAFMTQPWQPIATWGVLSGLASGGVAMVLAATVVNRWFVTRRGLIIGLLTASTATGNLVFLPILDWIATAPPTPRLANQAFGEQKAPVVFGRIAAGHQLGAASAAFMAGALRSVEGRYLEAFVFAGCTGFLAAGLSQMVGRFGRRAVLVPA